jgi:tRNA-splicing ligase RtcB
MTLTGKDLIEAGWPQGKVIGVAIEASLNEKHDPVQNLPLAKLELVREDPENWVGHHNLGDLAMEFIRLRQAELHHDELTIMKDYRIVGRELIDENTLEQMDEAMRLPVAVAGALMPDAHLGYGLPVGGVLATENQVIPWAVGVDIGCRMRLSVFDVSSFVLGQRRGELADILLRSTQFGAGPGFKEGRRQEHPVLDDPRWELTDFSKGLKDKAWAQLGTSGSGNHFVEWGSYTGTAAMDRLAILSHSGSRGVGFKIAQRYSKLAKKSLPKIGHLAWLDLDTEEGQEYWHLMNLAGDFAKANHEVIHQRMAEAIGHEPVAVVDHHHNFAWREEGQIVHRKGATPAHRGQLGVIPGSMAQSGYVVSGKGDESSLRSASHGAGRTMSRTQAAKTIDRRAWRSMLHYRKIKLIGGGIDEAPQAYKDIDQVLELQVDEGLVTKVGMFTPSIVRMDGDAGRAADRKRRDNA